jgi:hypothetical protein
MHSCLGKDAAFGLHQEAHSITPGRKATCGKRSQHACAHVHTAESHKGKWRGSKRGKEGDIKAEKPDSVRVERVKGLHMS